MERAEKPKHLKKEETYWLCLCDCGNKKIVRSTLLKNGYTTSCGCYHKERMSKHNKSKHPLYFLRQSIIQRCYNPKCSSYNLYGERGIKVCEEWLNSFQSFYDWSYENGYSDKKLPSGRNILTIDRIDNNGNYCPENCRWVTQKKQANNTRKNHLITIDGETKTMQEWCDLYGINKKAFYDRVKSGKVGKELLLPVKKRGV